jgi:hypothetical protein
VHGADQEAAFLPDEALGDAGAGGGRRFGVGGDPLDLAPEDAALGIELVDGDADAAQIVLARIAVLTRGVAGEPELDGLRLGEGPVVAPGAEERAGSGQGGRHRAALEKPTAG